jgi:hypothetical protein
MRRTDAEAAAVAMSRLEEQWLNLGGRAVPGTAWPLYMPSPASPGDVYRFASLLSDPRRLGQLLSLTPFLVFALDSNPPVCIMGDVAIVHITPAFLSESRLGAVLAILAAMVRCRAAFPPTRRLRIELVAVTDAVELDRELLLRRIPERRMLHDTPRAIACLGRLTEAIHCVCQSHPEGPPGLLTRHSPSPATLTIATAWSVCTSVRGYSADIRIGVDASYRDMHNFLSNTRD